MIKKRDFAVAGLVAAILTFAVATADAKDTVKVGFIASSVRSPAAFPPTALAAATRPTWRCVCVTLTRRRSTSTK